MDKVKPVKPSLLLHFWAVPIILMSIEYSNIEICQFWRKIPWVAFCNFLCNFVIFSSAEPTKLPNGNFPKPLAWCLCCCCCRCQCLGNALFFLKWIASLFDFLLSRPHCVDLKHETIEHIVADNEILYLRGIYRKNIKTIPLTETPWWRQVV